MLFISNTLIVVYWWYLPVNLVLSFSSSCLFVILSCHLLYSANNFFLDPLSLKVRVVKRKKKQRMSSLSLCFFIVSSFLPDTLFFLCFYFFLLYQLLLLIYFLLQIWNGENIKDNLLKLVSLDFWFNHPFLLNTTYIQLPFFLLLSIPPNDISLGSIKSCPVFYSPHTSMMMSSILSHLSMMSLFYPLTI